MAITLEPIGHVRSRVVDRYRAPRQPGVWAEPSPAMIELCPGRNFEMAATDLAGIERIWVIACFDRSEHHWRPRVMPPRGPRVRRGVFATRSPHRPNPIALSLVTLRGVRGRFLDVDDVDLLDGTPVLDIKPYLPMIEAHPDSRAGWIDTVEAIEPVRFELVWTALADAQCEWLQREHGIALRDVVTRVLGDDPRPIRPSRRITQRADGTSVLAVKSWRVGFVLIGSRVEIAHIASGYPAHAVAAAAVGSLEDDRAHREFHLRHPAT